MGAAGPQTRSGEPCYVQEQTPSRRRRRDPQKWASAEGSDGGGGRGGGSRRCRSLFHPSRFDLGEREGGKEGKEGEPIEHAHIRVGFDLS